MTQRQGSLTHFVAFAAALIICAVGMPAQSDKLDYQLLGCRVDTRSVLQLVKADGTSVDISPRSCVWYGNAGETRAYIALSIPTSKWCAEPNNLILYISKTSGLYALQHSSISQGDLNLLFKPDQAGTVMIGLSTDGKKSPSWWSSTTTGTVMLNDINWDPSKRSVGDVTVEIDNVLMQTKSDLDHLSGRLKGSLYIHVSDRVENSQFMKRSIFCKANFYANLLIGGPLCLLGVLIIIYAFYETIKFHNRPNYPCLTKSAYPSNSYGGLLLGLLIGGGMIMMGVLITLGYIELPD